MGIVDCTRQRLKMPLVLLTPAFHYIKKWEGYNFQKSKPDFCFQFIRKKKRKKTSGADKTALFVLRKFCSDSPYNRIFKSKNWQHKKNSTADFDSAVIT